MSNNTSKDTTVFYHWWDAPSDAEPHANLRIPIILSIATLRAVSDVEICVLDLSDRDWGEWCRKLNFSVIKTQPSMKKHRDKVAGWRNLSRFFDIKQLIDHSVDYKKNIMYVDSDVFFIRDPFPLMCYTKKMCINRWNAGFFYFDRFYNHKFWDIYKNYTMAAVYSEEIRQVLKKYASYDSWQEVWDEMILDYMAVKHPKLFNFLPYEEHVTIQTITRANLDKLKMFHANSLIVANPLCKIEGERENCRGLLCLLIEEFYNNIRKVLSDEDLQKIYTEKEINYYLPQSFSLLKNIDPLLATRDDNHHYHLLKMIQKC